MNKKSGLWKKGEKILPTAALLVLFFAAFTFTLAVVSAADIYVPEGGNQTIQQAVNNATAGAHTQIEARGGRA